MTASDSYARGVRARAPIHLWIVGALAVLWNAMGSNGAEVMRASGAVFSAIIWALAIFLLVYSRAMATRRILK